MTIQRSILVLTASLLATAALAQSKPAVSPTATKDQAGIIVLDGKVKPEAATAARQGTVGEAAAKAGAGLKNPGGQAATGIGLGGCAACDVQGAAGAAAQAKPGAAAATPAAAAAKP